MTRLKTMSTRIFAISDIHVDHAENLQWVESLSNTKYLNDVLIVAGDVTDRRSLLKSTLTSLTQRFKDVFFVPGNHELWIRDKAEDPATSIIKFHQIIAACKDIGVHTDPKKISLDDTSKEYAWIVPLFAWYATPEDSTDSLYVTSLTEDVKLTTSLWMDNRMCVWPDYPNIPPSKYFTDLNKDRVKVYDAPVISFSHFLPRQDLIRADETDDERMTAERRRIGLSELDTPRRQGAMAGFNFTRYAGCATLERQLRQIGSRVHVFGHQHRNRDRTVDGVRYVSHCLGYKRERQQGLICGIAEWMGPKQVWPL